jgi:hypothetical protein
MVSFAEFVRNNSFLCSERPKDKDVGNIPINDLRVWVEEQIKELKVDLVFWRDKAVSCGDECPECYWYNYHCKRGMIEVYEEMLEGLK